MKTTPLILILFLTGLGLRAQTMSQTQSRSAVSPAAPVFPAPAPVAPVAATQTVVAGAPATPVAAAPPEEMIPAGDIDFQGVDISQVLEVYAKLVGRTLLRAGLPPVSIILKTETPLTKSEAIEALQAVLALNNVSVVNVGDKFVKVLPSEQANAAGAEFNNSEAANLPELGSYVTRIVQLKYVKPSEMMPAITPFARLGNAIVPLDSNGILIIRDYAENVKRMLEMIDQVDVSVPEEYISEVIPIKYALAADIASALNSLGGSGNATVSIGSSAAAPTVNGFTAPRTSASGTQSPYSGNRPTTGGAFGPTANGTPATGTTFQQRLQSIISRASGGPGQQQDQIQVFGETKIIADQRSNSLLIFATAADMERIKAVVAKLDVLLSQVLIESVIIDVELDKALTLGVSAAQNPKIFSPSQGIAGGGGFNNGPSFLNFLNSSAPYFSAGTNTANALSSGLSYFGNIGPNWDVALQAVANDNNATVIQRPRIQTSQAKPATFFVGQTIPYITSTYNNGVDGNSSSYSQLSVGVELDVTPFINPDGLVVMDINQEIDDVIPNSGQTVSAGVTVPETDKRTLSSEIAVKDKDTIMLGGFVRSSKSHNKSGIPFLQDIPLLGNLFTQRNDSKDRGETIVLIRPTVLRTPTIAADQAITEEQRLPGIAHAEADDAADAKAQIDAERKAELKAAKSKKHSAGVFTTVPPSQVIDTNGTLPGINGGIQTTPPTFEN